MCDLQVGRVEEINSQQIKFFWELTKALPDMVGHLNLQGMEDSLKDKNREGLLDSPDSGLPPSPSPPFYSISPGISESRAEGSTTPTYYPGYAYKREVKEGKVVSPLFLSYIFCLLGHTRIPLFVPQNYNVSCLNMLLTF